MHSPIVPVYANTLQPDAFSSLHPPYGVLEQLMMKQVIIMQAAWQTLRDMEEMQA